MPDNEVWTFLIFVLALYQVSLAAVVVRNNLETYQWKTDSWGGCIRRTKCGEGHKIRKVWCLSSSGFSVSNSNCDESTKPVSVKNCFIVCDHHEFVLRWKISNWSPCKSIVSSHCTDSTPIKGISHRSVKCVLSSTHLVVENEACKYFWDKPESEMSCSLDCSQKCVTAKKNITCRIEECSEVISWTQEVDDVLVAPNAKRSDCSNINGEPMCKKERFIDNCKSFGNKKFFALKIGSWSPCTTEMDQSEETSNEIRISLNPKLGASTRNITCMDETGSETDMRFCKEIDSPPLIRRCVVPVHCVVSPWSEWHVQEEGCIASDGLVYAESRIRKRRLLQMPVGVGANPCPPLFEERSIKNDLPPCTKYKWYPLEWTNCQIMIHKIHSEVSVLNPTCGSGLQYRNLTCLRTNDMVPVMEVFCKNPQPNTVQRCKIPCKRDCQVSHWARWGPCMPYNNTNFMELIESGYRRRVRSVLVNPSNDGEPCPHLEELDVCLDVEIFDWQYGNWSACALSNPHATCGPGKKTRDYTCVNYDGVPMNDFMCNHHIPLMDIAAACRVPCPNDCIMSQWSQWSECSFPCLKEKEEGEFYRNRTILAISGEGGKPCKKNTKQREDCNMYSCSLYKWTTSNWGPCIPIQSNVMKCGKGLQRRKVDCRKGSEISKSVELCKYLKKPELERECELPCPVDCVLSNFTEWTNCNEICYPDMDQYRHRLIFQSFKNGGLPCPGALVQARLCSSTLKPHCVLKDWMNITYHWDTGPWSDCQLPVQNQVCGMGFQIRNVTCISSAKKSKPVAVEAHFCLPSGWTTLPDDTITSVPSGLRSCEVACSSNCAVSAWSAWSKCSYTYQSKRSRRRELVGISASNENCLQKIKLLEENECPAIPVNLTESVDNHWMSCIVNGTTIAVNDQLIKYSCGQGYRYKFGIEMNSKSEIGPGLERDFCWTDCPEDCQMSEWSDWTECNVPCGQGFRERWREILVPSNHLGRPCPETVNKTEIQKNVCNIVCGDYHWLAGGWADCQLEDPDAICGTGTYYRNVRCLDRRTEQKVDEARCDPLTKPVSIETCRIFCPGECVVSPWHVSKKCTEPCSNEDFLEQHRSIIRHPNTTATPCPPLITRIPCVLNSTCHHHAWILGPWGSCVLPQGAHCGEGVQKRPLICLRSDDRQVDPIQCEKTHKSLSLREPISKPCYTDCPVDCIMSEWSAWNRSSCSACGPIGVITRTRRILQPPSDAGQQCPSETEQRMPCDFKPCYHWKHSEWSQCDLEDANCGYGVRRRVVECIRFDHLKVDKAHCLVVNVTFSVNGWIEPVWLAVAQESHEEELCHVPCPGDCIVTEWSDWSHCHKNCRIGQKIGYQTSSRQVLFPSSENSSESCPKQLWRTKPCWNDDCDMFAWKLRSDSYICESKNGRIVQGGCTSEPRPCISICEKLGGTCENTTGVCYCEDGKGEKTILGPSSRRCKTMGKGPRPPANHSAPTPEIRLKYYPDDSQVSFWMYAMISIGTAFVIFVAVTVYLMCRSSLRQRTVSVERQPSVRRRAMESSPDVRSHCPH